MRKKQRVYNLTKWTQNPQHWKKFKELRKTWKRSLLVVHNDYVLGLLDWSDKKNSPYIGKKFWTYIKSKRKDKVGISSLNSGNTEITDNKTEAEILSNQFKAVFTDEDVDTIPDMDSSGVSDYYRPTCISHQGHCVPAQEYQHKESQWSRWHFMWGADRSSRRNCPISAIYIQSLTTGEVPGDWKCANVTPVLKKGSKKEACNYRPVSLTSVPCKILEHIIFHHIMGHLDAHHILVNHQHGFCRGYSCESQLITIVEHLARKLDHGKQTDVLLLDFSKAFDTVPHKRLLKKLDHYGIHGQLIKWIESWLCGRTQTVVVKGSQSSPVTVTSGVPQGTVLDPLMFLLYINNIGLQITPELGLFADDSVLYGVVNNISSVEVLQSDLNKLVVWSEKRQMAFNASKCFLLRVTRSRDNVVNYTYTMMGQPITSVTQHKYLGVELESKLTWKEHISAITGKANSSLGSLTRNLYNYPEQIKTQAYYSLVRPHLEYACSVWDPHTQKNIQSIEKVQRRAARFDKKCNSITN